MSMEGINGTMSYQCQVPQYNAVKIDIHQPKVQAPGNNACCDKHCPECKLYGQKGNNSVSMPLPSNVVVAKKEQAVKGPVVEEQNSANNEAFVDTDEPKEQVESEV